MSKDKPEMKYKDKSPKRGFNLFFIFIIAIILIIAVVYAVSINSPSKALTQSCRNVETPYEEQEEYLKTEYYTESVPYTDTECETKNLIYSATNERWVQSDCNHQTYLCYEDGFFGCKNETYFCDSRTLTYAVDINNQDEQGGTWVIDINFYLEGELYESRPVNDYLYPKTTKTFLASIDIKSDSPSGDANKNGFGGNFMEKTIPTKQVCKDVIKYREVQRERQVTAYRPVTKYKTEQVCN